MTTPIVLFGEDQIRARVQALGREITAHYAGSGVCVVGLIKSSLVFMADLIRALPPESTCHLLRVKQGEGGDGPREIVYASEIEVPYEGLDVLLIDDVVDTGITLNFILDHIRERKPRSLRTCVLIDKPGERKIEVRPDWSAFTLEGGGDGFLVGYGLDFQERYRGLPFLGKIPRVAAGAERV